MKQRILLYFIILHLSELLVSDDIPSDIQWDQESQLIDAVLQNSSIKNIKITTSSGDDQQNTRTNIIQYQNYSQLCSCNQLTTQVDCMVFNCVWEDANCLEHSCSDYDSQSYCMSNSKCLWNQFGCEQRDNKQCSDYTDLYYCEQQADCYFLNSECLEGEINCSNYSEYECASHLQCTYVNNKCVSKKIIKCQDLTTQFDCLENQNDQNYCYWINNQCLTINTTNCYTINYSDPCIYNFCKWQNNYCQEADCEDQAENCSTIITLRDGQYIGKMCQMNQETYVCQPLYDFSQLTSENCVYDTLGTYYWDESECKKCSSWSHLFSWYLILLIFLQQS